MANIKSAKKRARQNIKRKNVNKSKISRIRTYIKKLSESINNGDKKLASELLSTVQSLLAKAAKSPALERRTASRKTSRLSKQVAKL